MYNPATGAGPTITTRHTPRHTVLIATSGGTVGISNPLPTSAAKFVGEKAFER